MQGQGRPKGLKHTEESKAKMHKPHKDMCQEGRDIRSVNKKRYEDAKKLFTTEYVKAKAAGLTAITVSIL